MSETETEMYSCTMAIERLERASDALAACDRFVTASEREDIEKLSSWILEIVCDFEDKRDKLKKQQDAPQKQEGQDG